MDKFIENNDIMQHICGYLSLSDIMNLYKTYDKSIPNVINTIMINKYKEHNYDQIVYLAHLRGYIKIHCDLCYYTYKDTIQTIIKSLEWIPDCYATCQKCSRRVCNNCWSYTGDKDVMAICKVCFE